jgi:hypothetical protein
MDQSPTPDASAEAPRRDRRPLIIGVGALVAVGLGALVAFGIFRSDPEDETPPPAAEGGLQIELGQTQGGETIDPARPLRCFVDGRFVGELTVARCAERNGVAAQGLDVGIDETGALAAVVAGPAAPEAPDTALDVPLPVPVDTPPPVIGTAPGIPTGECLRDVSGEWRNLGDALARDTCVQVLFAGRCLQPGDAVYGRWGAQTLRLVAGRVEYSTDGVTFRTLVQQDPQTCMLP